MFGSSSTTSRRASGAGRPLGWLPVTAPPAGRADAVVMAGSLLPTASPALDGTCELPGKPLAAGGRHGPALPPVADRVVLRPAQPPPAAQVGTHGPDGGGLGGHPGEEVVAVRAVERGDRVGEQRALARRGATVVQPAHLDAVRRRHRLLLLGPGDLDQG